MVGFFDEPHHQRTWRESQVSLLVNIQEILCSQEQEEQVVSLCPMWWTRDLSTLLARSLSLFAFLLLALMPPDFASDPLCENLHLCPRAQVPLA